MIRDMQRIVSSSIAAVMPGHAVKEALSRISFDPAGRLIVIAVGKAAWEMASAASGALSDRIDQGIVITKYGHAKGGLPSFDILEAGHPVPDENSFRATRLALSAVRGLSERDSVLFLLSGGGSALFESPLIPGEELAAITGALLASGAGITEINTIRKRLSAVKGGRFALACAPAHVYSVILSDIIGDPLDMIASGPAAPDRSTCADSHAIVNKYHIPLSDAARALLSVETPRSLPHVTNFITGSVKELAAAASGVCRELGYEPFLLTTSLSCEAREAGSFLAAIARDHQDSPRSIAFLAGGETVVHLTGNGRGGRNQEIALSAARGINGLRDTMVFSFGSDGTDGPTDAAGGWADGNTMDRLRSASCDAEGALSRNNAYTALGKAGCLIRTGPTGTNVNDLSCILIRR